MKPQIFLSLNRSIGLVAMVVAQLSLVPRVDALPEYAWTKPECTACGFVYFDSYHDEEDCTSIWYVSPWKPFIEAGVVSFSPMEALCPDGAIFIPHFNYGTYWEFVGDSLGFKFIPWTSTTALIVPSNGIANCRSGTLKVQATDNSSPTHVVWTGNLEVFVEYMPPVDRDGDGQTGRVYYTPSTIR